MNPIIEAIYHRRSIRKYTEEAIPDDILDQILQAGLLAPTSANKKSTEFIVVKDRRKLSELAKMRKAGSAMLDEAYCAIVVIADTQKASAWVEDGAIAVSLMHFAADSLGVGSCIVQGNQREHDDGVSVDSYLRKILGYPEHLHVIETLALGMPAETKDVYQEQDLLRERVHTELFRS